MAKYIDADLLRKEIKRRIENLKIAELAWSKQGDTETVLYYSGKSVALDEFTDFIDSLQQEQPSLPDNLNEAAENHARTKYGLTRLLGAEMREVEDDFKAGAQWVKDQLTVK